MVQQNNEENKLVFRLYEKLLLIRRFEEKIAEIYVTDVIKSPVHLSIGQEAVAVGVCDVLADDDIVSNTYRCHATHIAKGGDLNKMMAELYGKKDGCAGGKAGSMHLIEIEKGIMGASAIVGSTIPVAVGYAMALKKEAKKTGKQRVVVAFFGDGATEEGAFSESINFAALHKLPIIFLCENNKLAIHSRIENRWPTDKICERIATYGLKTHKITDGDIFKIRDITKEAVNEIKNGVCAPIFIECHTYRYKEHVGPIEDLNEEYRDLKEYEKWSKNDQIKILGEMIDEKECEEIHKKVEKQIQESIDFASKSEFPGQKEFYENALAPRKTKVEVVKNSKNPELIRYVDAIAQACAQEMESDENVFVYGLDVDDHKKIQGSTAGLEKFGKDRFFGTPLSEDAMTGIAVGAAMYGLRPVHVHIRMDFLTLAANQLINMAAKAHYMYNGQVCVPMVVRALIGRSWGQGAQHSQALHATFAHIPGLRVVAPSNAYDAKGCMIAAIRDNNPVIFMEHRLLCNAKSYVPQESYEVEIGKGRVVKEGKDITIVAISHMNIEAVRAAKYLKDSLGIQAEVIDPIWINPLDIDLIKKSVAKTKNLLIVDNGWVEFGVSAEIASKILEEFQKDGKEIPQIHRSGFAQVTCPTTRSLEDIFYPNSKTIADKSCEILKKDKIDWTKVKVDNEELEEFKGPF